MLEGILTVNLDPPYLTFDASTGSGMLPTILCECTEDDIFKILLELGRDAGLKWPVRDCIIRSQGQFPKEMLSRFHLLPPQTPSYALGTTIGS